jgi:hypothetical protein
MPTFTSLQKAFTAWARHISQATQDGNAKTITPANEIRSHRAEAAAGDRFNRLFDDAPGSRLSLGIVAAIQFPSC